jgi:hypothetical protein
MISMAKHSTAALVVMFSLVLSARGAFLDGSQMLAGRTYRETSSMFEIIVSSSPVIVGPGVEFPNFGGSEVWSLAPFVDIDVANKSITITALTDQPPGVQEFFEITDPFHTISRITSVKLNPATTWAGFTQGRAYPLASYGVLINAGGLMGLQGQKIVVDVVPEPATASMAAAGLLLAALRRQARRPRSR